jgi:fluoroquinolone transport system permease protein
MSLVALLSPIAVAGALRFLLPVAALYLDPYVEIMAYYPAILGMVIMFPAMLSGMLGGFLMLDERDDGTLYALQTTPLSGRQYVFYRILSPVVMGILLALLMVALLGSSGVPLTSLIMAATLSGLMGPIWAYGMYALAENKIEGLAVLKFMSLLIGLPLLSLFIPASYTPLFWVLPFFWPFYLVAGPALGMATMSPAAMFAAGLLVSGIYLAGLSHQVAKRQA